MLISVSSEFGHSFSKMFEMKKPLSVQMFIFYNFTSFPQPSSNPLAPSLPLCYPLALFVLSKG